MNKITLQATGIHKTFPGVKALDDVGLALYEGEVLALVGENGPSMVSYSRDPRGLVRPDAGRISIDGRDVMISSPLEAAKLGIGFVHQESNLLSNLTVLENVFLAREVLGPVRSLSRANMASEILRVNGRLGYKLDPDKLVGSLNLAEQQCVEIARALLAEPRILILDEPTAALDEEEVRRLFGIIRTLKRDGVSIIYISHRLEEVMEIADRVMVLKDGKAVGTLDRQEIDRDRLISMMVGRVLEDIYPDRSDVRPGEPLLTVENLAVGGRARDVSFTVRAGEIVSLGGLEGQGQRAVARAIFGDVPVARGRIAIRSVRLSGGSIAQRIKSGLGYITHDRRGEGLVLTLSMGKNCSLASLPRLKNRIGYIRRRRERAEILENVERMQIKLTSVDQAVDNLSGGNQQKVMLSRWLMTKPRVLIVDEPTKGVDVGARMSVYRIIDQLTREGIGILMLTSDMMELIGLSDRILVFYEGRIVREFGRGDAREEAIMRAASGLGEGEGA